MSDKYIRIPGVNTDGSTEAHLLLHDNGDGTFSLSTASGQSALPASTTLQNAATVNGNGANLNVQGYAVAILRITSSPAMSGGTLVNFEASADDTNWDLIVAHQIGINGSLGSTTSTDGAYRIAVAGFKSLRARISNYSAGTVTIKGYVNPVASQPTAIALAVGANIIGALVANQSVNNAQVAGATIDTNSGNKSAGTQRTVLATDQPNLTTPLNVKDAADGTVAAGTAAANSMLGGLVYNSSAPAPTTGQQVALQGDSAGNLFTNPGALSPTNDSVAIGGGLMPTGTALNTYSTRITTNTTTTPTSATAYISTIAISTEAIGTTSTIKIQDKQGTPLVLVPDAITTTKGLITYNFQSPVKMVGGIDIVTAGAVAATVDVFMNYYQ